MKLKVLSLALFATICCATASADSLIIYTGTFTSSQILVTNPDPDLPPYDPGLLNSAFRLVVLNVSPANLQSDDAAGEPIYCTWNLIPCVNGEYTFLQLLNGPGIGGPPVLGFYRGVSGETNFDYVYLTIGSDQLQLDLVNGGYKATYTGPYLSETITRIANTPEPSSAILGLTGLIALAAIRNCARKLPFNI